MTKQNKGSSSELHHEVDPPHSWKGLSAEERTAARRKLLLVAARELLASQGEASLSIRSIATRARLNTRYFYESFEAIDDVLGAAFDELNVELAEAMIERSTGVEDPSELLRIGILTVLEFIEDKPERSCLLFSEGQSNATLIQRRRGAQDLLILLVRERPATPEAARELATDRRWLVPAGSRQPGRDVAGPMFAGAMNELVLAWLRGDIEGTTFDIASDAALRIERILR